MSHAGKEIGVSSEPLFDAARYLLAHGLAGRQDMIVTFRDGGRCMAGNVGKAARLTVVETPSFGPAVRQYKAVRR
jgi:hypothetical protein